MSFSPPLANRGASKKDPAHWKLKESVTLGLRWQAASWAASEPLQAISGKPLVDGISRSTGNQPEYRGERKRKSQKIEHSQDSGRAQQNRAVLDQNNRARTALGQPGLPHKRSARLALTCGKAKDISSVEPQQEINPAVAEYTLSVENHDCPSRAFHLIILA
jgi:hypothetical protein